MTSNTGHRYVPSYAVTFQLYLRSENPIVASSNWDLEYPNPCGLGRFDEAVEDATAAIALEPADTETLAVAYTFRGLALLNVGQVAEATADLERVTRLLPSTHQMHIEVAEMLTNLDKTN